MITYIEIENTGVPKRAHTRLVRESLGKVARNHLYKTMGDHFKVNAKTAPGGPYGYKQRSPEYVKFKQRTFGHNLPNVATGKLKRSIRNNSRITSTSTKTTIYLKGVNRSKREDRNFTASEQQWRELKAITPDEMRDAEQLAVDTYRKEAAKPENQSKRKRRI